MAILCISELLLHSLDSFKNMYLKIYFIFHILFVKYIINTSAQFRNFLKKISQYKFKIQVIDTIYFINRIIGIYDSSTLGSQ